MSEYLIECYLAREDVAAVERGAERSRLAAEELTRAGTPVRYLLSIFIPEDETCFFLYEAASTDVVREAAQHADLSFDRITQVLTTSHDERSSDQAGRTA